MNINRRVYKITSVVTVGSLVLALVLALVFNLLMAVPAHAAAISAKVTGNWSATGTWNGGVVPTSIDDVTIAADKTVTVDISNAACASLTLGATSGSKYGTLGFNASSQLTVGGNVTIGVGAGIGNINMTNSGTLQIGGTVTVTAAGIWTPGTGTVVYNGAAQTLPTTFFTTYNNLTINQSSGNATLGGAATVNGVLTLTPVVTWQ